MLSLINRSRIKDMAVVQALEHLVAHLRGLLSQAFDEDGQLIVADPNLAVVPVGAVQDYAGLTAPSGWLMCDGSQVSRVTYQSLYNVIGTTYGAGNGSTTFNLPDTRGRFALSKAAAGTGATLGATGGSLDHTHTVANHTHTGPTHSHSIADHTHTIGDHQHTGPSHTHTGPSHTHSISDSGGHQHNVTSHTHSITADSGHQHNVTAHSHGISGVGVLGSSSVEVESGSGTFVWPEDAVASVSGSTDSNSGQSTDTSGGHSHGGNTGAAAPSTDTSGGHNHGGATGAEGTGVTSASGTGLTGLAGAGSTGLSGVVVTGLSGSGDTGSAGGGNTGSSNPAFITFNKIIFTGVL